jgi:hypothetical protein
LTWLAFLRKIESKSKKKKKRKRTRKMTDKALKYITAENTLTAIGAANILLAGVAFSKYGRKEIAAGMVAVGAVEVAAPRLPATYRNVALGLVVAAELAYFVGVGVLKKGPQDASCKYSLAASLLEAAVVAFLAVRGFKN